jgi:hypothetical protein
MKYLITTALTLAALGAASAPALAGDQPSPKGPPQTMGDEGKLPATGTMTNKVPEMGATGAGSGESGAASPSPKGPPQRMGDEGKLPATGTMSRKVPQMTSPSGSEK